MRVLYLLTYYRPHLSGLTASAAHSAEHLAALGHQVTVLTSRHDDALACQERIDGVDVVRVPAFARIGKGPLMRGYWRRASALMKAHDVALLHLPATPTESLAAALAARWHKTPLAAEYVCDIRLPGGLLSRIVESVVGRGNAMAAAAARTVIASSTDYAAHSAFLRRREDKLAVLPLPIRISRPNRAAVERLRAAWAPHGEPLIGIAARMAADKGFETLIDALPLIQRELPAARIVHAGEVERVVGESAYRRAMLARIAALGTSWLRLGVVEPDLANFLAACDVLVLPSVNSTESFGMVQAEAMLCGTPVVASDLPGVRIAVSRTGMGLTAPPRDAAALARAVVRVVRERAAFVRPRESVESLLDIASAFDGRVQLLAAMAGKKSHGA